MIERVVIDFETRSTADLKKTGQYKYSLCDTTRATCLSIKDKLQKEVFLLPFEEVHLPWDRQSPTLKKWWVERIKRKALFVAHNAGFEIAIYNNVLVARLDWPVIPLEQWRCTAAKAAACALPRSLAGAGEALKLPIQKDWRGHAAVMATCKPTKEYKAWLKKESSDAFWVPDSEAAVPLGASLPTLFLEPDRAPDVFDTLYQYCKIDTATEELLDQSLPDLIEQEQRNWFLNQKINTRGFSVDASLIRKITNILKVETRRQIYDLDKLTLGLVDKPGARRSILDFLGQDEIKLPDIQAKTVEDVLKNGNLTEDGEKLLKIRRALSKASTKKYAGFLDRVCPDGRVRDILLYHGGHTGRDSGTGIQIQNFPKGVIEQEDIEYIISHLGYPDIAAWIKGLYGDLGAVFASLLRSMIIATPGCELFVGDLSLIEVCVLWWLAENTPGLNVLNSGKDPYLYMAAANTGQKYEDISKDSLDRQLGKIQTLACGFGMGAFRFKKTAWDFYRLEISDDDAGFAVKSYRRANSAVVALWKDYEDAAVKAIQSPKEIFEMGKCLFSVRKGFLWVKLPSGRKLAYREPRLAMRETDFGPRRSVEYWGVNSKTKKWNLQSTYGGKLTENIVQAVARDILYHPLHKLERLGYQTLFLVHDEIVSERKEGAGKLDEFLKVMTQRPEWVDAKLPLNAKGFVCKRYRK